MLKEIALQYYEKGYNCAESMLRAGNEYYQLGLHEHDMRMCAAFGGGFQLGDVCGVISGAACVISCRYVESKAHDYKDMREMTQKMVLAFQKRMKSRLCAEIKPLFYSKESKCAPTVAVGAEVLEAFIQEWDAHILQE